MRQNSVAFYSVKGCYGWHRRARHLMRNLGLPSTGFDPFDYLFSLALLTGPMNTVAFLPHSPRYGLEVLTDPIQLSLNRL